LLFGTTSRGTLTLLLEAQVKGIVLH